MKSVRPLACALLLALAALPALAAVSRDDAAAMAQQQTGGRVLSVELADAGGRAVWRVKVVTPRGDVRVVMIDAQQGDGGRGDGGRGDGGHGEGGRGGNGRWR